MYSRNDKTCSLAKRQITLKDGQFWLPSWANVEPTRRQAGGPSLRSFLDGIVWSEQTYPKHGQYIQEVNLCLLCFLLCLKARALVLLLPLLHSLAILERASPVSKMKLQISKNFFFVPLTPSWNCLNIQPCDSSNHSTLGLSCESVIVGQPGAHPAGQSNRHLLVCIILWGLFF